MKKEIIYFRESLIQSILADCVTFGFLIGGLLLNRFILGDHLYIGIFFVLGFFILGLELGTLKQKRFKNLKEFKEYIEKLT